MSASKEIERIVHGIPINLAEGPAQELEELAARYRSGELAGVAVAYVRGDGELEYKILGVFVEEEGGLLDVLDKFKRRLQRLFFGGAC